MTIADNTPCPGSGLAPAGEVDRSGVIQKSYHSATAGTRRALDVLAARA